MHAETKTAKQNVTAVNARETTSESKEPIAVESPGESLFRASVRLPVSPAKAFAWHERPGAFERLAPPWEHAETLEGGNGVAPGSRRVIGMKVGPMPVKWVAEHGEWEPGHFFSDVQLSGPFAKWEHKHLFEDGANGDCLHEDTVRYRVPGGVLGRAVAGRGIAKKLARVFGYRHAMLVGDLTAHERYANEQRQQVAISGSSGLVGTALAAYLSTDGHEIRRLVRDNSRNMPGFERTISWDATSGELDAAGMQGVTAVVHLAGESIAEGRWTEEKKSRIRASRIETTRKLCENLAGLATPPQVLVCASAIGFYGDRGDEELTETSPAGEGFLPEVCQQWEQATAPASEAGIRVIHARLGIVLSPRGGALAKMLTPFTLGGGGKIGSGQQWWSWVALDDVLGAIEHALLTPAVRGPMNVVAPHALTNAEFTKVLGRVLHRLTVLPMPATAARLALGEMADELLLASARVVPGKLLETGYEFRYGELAAALRYMLGRE